MTGIGPSAVTGAACGAGLVGVIASRWDHSHPLGRAGGASPWAHLRPRPRLGNRLPQIGLAVLAAAVAGLVTGWPVAAPIAGIAAYTLPRLFRATSGSLAISKIEAIATWTEMLQGTLAAAAGLNQAIVATATMSPLPIRAATSRLSAQLVSGVHPRDALLEFADEVSDPCADRVVCALLLATTSRAQQLGELLSALADSTRDEVALRLRIETSRASIRSGVRTVLVFSVVFAGALALLAHSYLSPFGTPTGQLVLVLVAVLYGSGLVLMVHLARPPQPVRLLGSDVIER